MRNSSSLFPISNNIILGYGDSSEVELIVEEDVVEDAVFIYKWLKRRITNAEIFIWGHALGAAIGTRATAKLQKEKIVPAGLFLEAGFTELRELLLHNDILKVNLLTSKESGFLI